MENEEAKIDDVDSILVSIKKLLGLSKDCTDFDTDIKIHINTVLMNLDQLGVTIPKKFKVSDNKQLWSEIISDESRLDSIVTYVYLKVRLVFDPPISSAVMDAIKQTISELEWRIMIQIDENNSKKEV